MKPQQENTSGMLRGWVEFEIALPMPSKRVLDTGGFEFPAPTHRFIKPALDKHELNQGASAADVWSTIDRSALMKYLRKERDWCDPTLESLLQKYGYKARDTTTESSSGVRYNSKWRNPIDIKKGMHLCLPDFLSYECPKRKSSSEYPKRNFLVRFGKNPVDVRAAVGRKYVLICCFLVPLRADFAKLCSTLIAAYPELSTNYNFEMVMVAKMRSGFEHDRRAFYHFFSAFPCPAIPFEDSTSRDFICQSLGLSGSNETATVLVSPQETILHTNCDFLRDFGAASFPFTTAKLDALKKADLELFSRLDILDKEDEDEVDPDHRDVSLEEVLGLKSSFCLQKFPSREEISLADLGKNKCVAVYLCANGAFMERLHELQQKCVTQNLEFEVVIVFMPFSNDHVPSFLEAAMFTMQMRNISSWWTLPSYKDSVSRKLRHLISDDIEDKVIVLVQDEKVGGDCMGREVMEYFGIYAYPFTRISLVEKKLLHLKESCTLTSLFLGNSELRYAHLVCHNKPYPRIRPVADEIKKCKRILLYLDYPHLGDGLLYSKVVSAYRIWKRACPDVEVVFVPLMDFNPRSPSVDRSGEMPWLVLPSENAPSVVKSVFFANEGQYPSLVAFDEDGQLLSRCAQDQNGLAQFLFKDTLRDEMISYVKEVLSYG